METFSNLEFDGRSKVNELFNNGRNNTQIKSNVNSFENSEPSI